MFLIPPKDRAYEEHCLNFTAFSDTDVFEVGFLHTWAVILNNLLGKSSL